MLLKRDHPEMRKFFLKKQLLFITFSDQSAFFMRKTDKLKDSVNKYARIF